MGPRVRACSIVEVPIREHKTGGGGPCAQPVSMHPQRFLKDAPEGRNRSDEWNPLTVTVMQRKLVPVVHVMLQSEGCKALVIVSVANERHLDGELSELLATIGA